MATKEEHVRKPEWLKIKLNTNENYTGLKKMMREKNLHTVCEEARCPNIHECWAVRRTATFMILGEVCTRACRFCAVKTGLPTELDLEEPERVADSVQLMNLKHAVITVVARDDLKDGGASVLAETIRAIRRKNPFTTIEVLPSDMGGVEENLRIVMDARPDILNHNIETVRSLTPRVRARAKYERSLEFLRRAKEMQPDIPTKSSIMLGLGETKEEIIETMDDLRANNVDIMTLGQYLQPTKKHIKVQKYYHPNEFEELKEIALSKGFSHVEAGPLVRSSYHADEQVNAAAKNKAQESK
ncbi:MULTISPECIES: lipoyl synthase [Priestia]|mgnify:CR=1 FL=1|jgi:lipoyl synthase|uniref:Lipoyl synthase n=7 Tax=Priestia TaxID=2800373 RepID=D5DV92_PRIM1|nr:MULTISPECIES: lipoyl synthase [Priestia]AVX10825.1 lipoyl synthase [Bacillus sp. Y-01]KOP76890.1 lipoyl synthase [Bacillus sp. FJAT-21351]KQU18311.1 lipoyl synthase [Bacillus sp. Leaf75]KRD82799.1 lipoyl synthase [Bacillus sp. Root147]KRD95354.1 lipoyl synthase [Bacillus sp. Root239]KRF47643.1 lipoyl synthase [Bacillus sp. Soil531]MBK0294679.1 lipoyl synthase [Bacillus sp. S34]MBU8854812.1 lipoyl synthase [Bacillus sp. FJAT-26377]MBZ5481988.1 lipoyl synthase [Bacillus sp. T_4]MCF679883